MSTRLDPTRIWLVASGPFDLVVFDLGKVKRKLVAFDLSSCSSAAGRACEN